MTLSAVPEDGAVRVLVAEAVVDRSPKGIAAAVHRLIRAGRLQTGDRLPTVRDLAKDLSISPATVSEAWQALGAVGAIQARGRAGTFVRDTVEPTRPVRYLGIGGAPLAEGINLSTGTPDPALLPAPARGRRAGGGPIDVVDHQLPRRPRPPRARRPPAP